MGGKRKIESQASTSKPEGSGNGSGKKSKVENGNNGNPNNNNINQALENKQVLRFRETLPPLYRLQRSIMKMSISKFLPSLLTLGL